MTFNKYNVIKNYTQDCHNQSWLIQKALELIVWLQRRAKNFTKLKMLIDGGVLIPKTPFGRFLFKWIQKNVFSLNKNLLIHKALKPDLLIQKEKLNQTQFAKILNLKSTISISKGFIVVISQLLSSSSNTLINKWFIFMHSLTFCVDWLKLKNYMFPIVLQKNRNIVYVRKFK